MWDSWNSFTISFIWFACVPVGCACLVIGALAMTWFYEDRRRSDLVLGFFLLLLGVTLGAIGLAGGPPGI